MTLATVTNRVRQNTTLLEPYPDWGWHRRTDCEGIVSVFRTFVSLTEFNCQVITFSFLVFTFVVSNLQGFRSSQLPTFNQSTLWSVFLFVFSIQITSVIFSFAILSTCSYLFIFHVIHAFGNILYVHDLSLLLTFVLAPSRRIKSVSHHGRRISFLYSICHRMASWEFCLVSISIVTNSSRHWHWLCIIY